MCILSVAQATGQDCDPWQESFLNNVQAIESQENEVHAQYCNWEFYNNGGNNVFAVEMNEANAARYWSKYQDELLVLDMMELGMSFFIVDMGIAGCL